jgi:hypothetical protein
MFSLKIVILIWLCLTESNSLEHFPNSLEHFGILFHSHWSQVLQMHCVHLQAVDMLLEVWHIYYIISIILYYIILIIFIILYYISIGIYISQWGQMWEPCSNPPQSSQCFTSIVEIILLIFPLNFFICLFHPLL